MSILRSLYTGATGLGAHAEALGAVGDNIANVNTLGYRAQRARFEELVSNAVGMGKLAGQGSRMAGIEAVFTQGALLATGVPTDVAIQGEGFLVVNGSYNGITGDFYTRVGQFHLDADGVLVNPDDLAVQGYQADASGAISQQIGNIQIPNSLPPQWTQDVTMSLNLDASQSVGPAWSAANPSGTSNYSTSLTVYDSLGAAHTVTVYFRKASATSWEWHAMVDGGELTGGTAGVPTEVASGTLGFTTDGALDSEVTTASDFDFLGATQNQAIGFDFGDSITTDGGTGLAGTTAFAAPSTVNGLDQDGFAAGSVAGFSIDADGVITAAFSNGRTRTIAQLAIADFKNEQGLIGVGGSLYAATRVSGEALVGTAATGGRGAINAGALEASNVDLAREFVSLIAYQRGFQANARTVTTADEMMSDLVNLKR